MVRNIATFVCFAIGLSGCYACGTSSTNNEVTAQVKKVVKVTPLLCPDYVELNVSLGVLRNGVGSMSHEDMTLRVMDESMIPDLEQAAKHGSIITLKYDVARSAWCYPDHKMISWQLDIDPTKTPPVAPAAPTAAPPAAAEKK